MDYIPGGLNLPLPRVIRVRQKFPRPREADPAVAVARELARPEISGRMRPGDRICIGVGSRGLAQLAPIAGALVAGLKACGASPVIIPAMGSHGGGTPEGQLAVLAGYGITPAAMGCPIDPAMETVEVGRTAAGVPVHVSAVAAAADGLVPLNRIKVHTDFHGPVESGLAKMLAIGFGKHAGAATLHQQGFDTFATVIPAAARLILQQLPVLFGLATVENAYEDVARVEAVPAEAILAREPELLALSRDLMARLLFERLDVLVVDELGKDISGAGMDPNVTGRYGVRFLSGPLQVQKLVVLGLTERSHGNASGMGYADVTTRRLVRAMDVDQTYTNIITSTLLEGGRIPVTMPTDRDAICLGIRTCNRIDYARPWLVRIKNTLELQEIYVSDALWQECAGRPGLEPASHLEDMAFDQSGTLLPMEVNP